MLKRIKTPISPELEITEITDRVSKFNDHRNVALLFENVKGYDMPVLINAFGSYERMALALGVEKLDQIADEIRQIMKLPYLTMKDKSNVLSILQTARKAINFPKYVRNAPCQEVVMERPSLDKIPILKCWPQDGGKILRRVNATSACIDCRNTIRPRRACIGTFIKTARKIFEMLNHWGNRRSKRRWQSEPIRS